MFRCRAASGRDELCPCSRNKIYRSLYLRHCANSEDRERLSPSRGRSGSGTSQICGRVVTSSTPGSTTSGGRRNTSGTKGNSHRQLEVQPRAGRCPAEFCSCAHSCRTMLSIVAATVAGSSCSQTRRTRQPWSTSSVVVCSSRSTFAASFAAHHAELFLAGTACSGQRCQKQPSTKTATRRLGNAMSMVRRGLPGTLTPTRNLRPRRCSSLRRTSSGAVLARLWERIRCRTSSVGEAGRDSSRATRSRYDRAQRRAVRHRRAARTLSVVPLLDAGTSQGSTGCGGRCGAPKLTEARERRAQQ